jgi:hypothetical protein
VPCPRPGAKGQGLCGWKKFTAKARKAHKGRGLKALFHSFVFLASRSPPWCAFAVKILVPGSFAYPVIECNQGGSMHNTIFVLSDKNDIRVVQKLQFLNNNRLKKKKNMGFFRKPMFFARLVQ